MLREDRERSIKIALLSSLFRMKFGGETCATPISGATFSTADHDQEMEWLTETVEPLRILSSERVQYDMLAYRLIFQGSTLADYLQSAPEVNDLDGKKILLTFLRISSTFDPRRHTRGDPPRPSLPTTREAFASPAHFVPVLDALCLDGYCDRKGPIFQWTDKIAPLMEEAWLWIDGVLATEVRQRELLRMWDTMPPKNSCDGGDHGRYPRPSTPFGRLGTFLVRWRVARQTWKRTKLPKERRDWRQLQPNT